LSKSKALYTKLKHKYERNLAFSIWSYELKFVAKGKVMNQIDNLTSTIKAYEIGQMSSNAICNMVLEIFFRKL
jgi:hypothetical protein